MQRIARAPRPDYRRTVEAQGLSYHAVDDYWTESACYRFTAAEIDEIEAATAELHRICEIALAVAVRDRRLGELGIPAAFEALVARSATARDVSLYGRFDLCYDGRSPPKLLEYNADTPTSLVEAAVCQWSWLEECFPRADQFNSLHDKLIARWRELPGTGPVALACVDDVEEDWACVAYLLDTLAQAGRPGFLLDIAELGWRDGGRHFVDADGANIGTLFKLYPWEWLMAEDFGRHLADTDTRFIEPAFKAALSSKGLLPLLWELFPEHPNLLPAYREPGRLRSYAKKPLFSREGSNIELVRDDAVLATSSGPYGNEGFIYQALCPLPSFDGHYPVLGSWLVGGEPAGLGIREGGNLITTNVSAFVPHYFEP